MLFWVVVLSQTRMQWDFYISLAFRHYIWPLCARGRIKCLWNILFSNASVLLLEIMYRFFLCILLLGKAVVFIKQRLNLHRQRKKQSSVYWKHERVAYCWRRDVIRWTFNRSVEILTIQADTYPFKGIITLCVSLLSVYIFHDFLYLWQWAVILSITRKLKFCL